MTLVLFNEIGGELKGKEAQGCWRLVEWKGMCCRKRIAEMIAMSN
jgi:hypothetical protein